MAGYVFSMGGDGNAISSIKKCIKIGVYSTYIKSISSITFEGTMADYLSMKPGDNVYFFSKRKIYGIGELIKIGPDCKYCNYPNSSEEKNFSYEEISDSVLLDEGAESPQYRWLCIFKGSPYFFEEGIDTDEVLSYKPDTFKMLRAFWKLSFIKLGDEENQSLKEIILLRHQSNINSKANIIPMDDSFHNELINRPLNEYLIKPEKMLAYATNEDKVTHEMALEANVVYDLCNGGIPQLGHWNYVSHQVVASPFKPIDYMDKIDVFATRTVNIADVNIVSKYLVAELKKDAATIDTIDQVLKYVDWVRSEYAYGDYGSIQACIIAAEFPEGISKYIEKNVKRQYTTGSHPVKNIIWSDIILLKYEYKDGKINYKRVDEYPIES